MPSTEAFPFVLVESSDQQVLVKTHLKATATALVALPFMLTALRQR